MNRLLHLLMIFMFCAALFACGGTGMGGTTYLKLSDASDNIIKDYIESAKNCGFKITSDEPRYGRGSFSVFYAEAEVKIKHNFVSSGIGRDRISGVFIYFEESSRHLPDGYSEEALKYVNCLKGRLASDHADWYVIDEKPTNCDSAASKPAKARGCR